MKESNLRSFIVGDLSEYPCSHPSQRPRSAAKVQNLSEYPEKKGSFFAARRPCLCNRLNSDITPAVASTCQVTRRVISIMSSPLSPLSFFSFFFYLFIYLPTDTAILPFLLVGFACPRLYNLTTMHRSATIPTGIQHLAFEIFEQIVLYVSLLCDLFNIQARMLIQ